MAEQVLVVDVGTSRVKAVCFDLQGRVRAEREAGYETKHPHDGWYEQDPNDWWRASIEAVAGLGDLSAVGVVALAGTMQSVIPVDRDGAPVRTAILYSDSRAGAEFRALQAVFTELRAAETIGNQPNELMAAFKMAWLLAAEPAAFERTAFFHSGAKDFVVSMMTGAQITDPTAATTTGLMNLRTRQWAVELAQAVGVAAERLPRIVGSAEQAGTLQVSAARALGLRSGVPVVNGIGDAGAATLGAGIRAAGEAYVYLGTSAWVAQIAKLRDLRLPQALYTLAHPKPDLAIRIGAMLAGGDCAEWCRELCGASFNVLERDLPGVDADPGELLFLPYLKGERSPFHDPAVRGAFLFLDRGHRPEHLFYAVLEGVAQALRANLSSLGPIPERLPVIGGGASSRLWPQIIADVCGTTVLQAEMPTTATAFGAFLLAAEFLDVAIPAPDWARPLLPRPERAVRSERRGSLFDRSTEFARAVASRTGERDAASAESV